MCSISSSVSFISSKLSSRNLSWSRAKPQLAHILAARKYWLIAVSSVVNAVFSSSTTPSLAFIPVSYSAASRAWQPPISAPAWRLACEAPSQASSTNAPTCSAQRPQQRSSSSPRTAISRSGAVTPARPARRTSASVIPRQMHAYMLFPKGPAEWLRDVMPVVSHRRWLSGRQHAEQAAGRQERDVELHRQADRLADLDRHPEFAARALEAQSRH